MFYIYVFIVITMVQPAVAPCPITSAPNRCYCYFLDFTSMRVVDCRNNSLNEVPKEVYRDYLELSFLYLQYNNITKINSTEFATLYNLNIINLRGNPLKIIPSYFFTRKLKVFRLHISAETIQPYAFVGLSSVETLTITDSSSLTYFPKSLFKPLTKVREIVVNSTSIEVVEKYMFFGLDKLKSIRMPHNAIKTIEDNAFTGNLNLEYLYLDHNNIELIPNRTFGNLNKLYLINLSSNRIKHLDEKTFLNLYSLSTLVLSNNNLHYLPPTIFTTLWKLRSLDLSSNNLTEVSSIWFDSLFASPIRGYLYKLYLSNNPIQTFSSRIIKNFGSLDVLHVRNTSLSRLSLQDPIRLRELDISQNCFTQPPAVLNRDIKLVFASESCLKRIPQYSSSEGTLDLHGNEIVVGELDKVHAKLLNLSYNKIQKISFQGHDVKKIDLSYNNISDLNQSDFSGHSTWYNRLSELILRGNNIKLIGTDFKELRRNVERLDLSENQINTIHENAFTSMSNLVDLNLSNNSLKSLGLQFNNIYIIKSLDLSLNPIEKIDFGFLESTKRLENLNLAQNNVLKCSCDLIIVLQMLPSIKNIKGHCTENNGRKKELTSMIRSISEISKSKCNLCKLPQICSNKGTCVAHNSTGFECQCIDGYKGRNCDISLVTCQKSQTCGLCDDTKCKNNGTCIDLTPKDFQCWCKTDFSGQFCETNLNPCLNSTCQNDGKCFRTTDQNFTCQCVNGFTGSHCDRFDCTRNQSCGICHKKLCKNNGKCVETSSINFRCRCPSNYVGTYCENKLNPETTLEPRTIQKNPCKPDPCVRGICMTETNGTYKCNCSYGFSGTHCSISLLDCTKTQLCGVCNKTSVCKNNGVYIETSLVLIWTLVILLTLYMES